MIKNILLIGSLFIMYHSFAQNGWTQKADFSGGIRYGAVGFSIGTKGYLGTGASTSTFWNDFWEYNPANNSWTQKATFPGAGRMWGSGFSIGTKGYLGLGVWYGGYYKDFYEYDQATNTWLKKTDFGGTARDQAVGFSVGAKGYIGTGRNSTGKDFWQYDQQTDAWTKKADFGGSARYDAVGFSIGAKGYIGTGLGLNNLPTNDFWEYDPGTDVWTQKTDFPGLARQFAVGFSTDTKGFIGLGSDETNAPNVVYYSDFWQYDQNTDAWTQKTNFPATVREASTGLIIGNKGYVGAGIKGLFENTTIAYLQDFWEFGDSSLTTTTPQAAVYNSPSVAYPNPSNGLFTLSYHLPEANGVLEIIDATGRVVYRQNVDGFQGLATIHASDLSAGNYDWHLFSGNELADRGKIAVVK